MPQVCAGCIRTSLYVSLLLSGSCSQAFPAANEAAAADETEAASADQAEQIQRQRDPFSKEPRGRWARSQLLAWHKALGQSDGEGKAHHLQLLKDWKDFESEEGAAARAVFNDYVNGLIRLGIEKGWWSGDPKVFRKDTVRSACRRWCDQWSVDGKLPEE